MLDGHKIYNNDCHLLYDSEILDESLLEASGAALLDTNFLQQVAFSQRITSGGRGQAWFVEIGGYSAVYRQYRRGGLVAFIIKQLYFGLNEENARSFKEWRLLHWMMSKNLPVPQPIAASVCRWPFKMSPFYRAKILVKRIPNALTLDQILSLRELSDAGWYRVGKIIRLFHKSGVFHADLNANNILLDNQLHVYLIDFDKGQLRDAEQSKQQWMQDNLNRFKRSLLKLQRVHKYYYFTEENWQMLISGYNIPETN
ncbi:3-deoxy-D-manno-octulosonic acid kinase [hydrothermal vent metagenome]|uniref:3-deoxy-D-manno-octulosonic acid kinase n=1 Tax=hydrothermal vent metagenome TaxID=652676 RepID=A0A3B0XCQ8_9ZZZZ